MSGTLPNAVIESVKANTSFFSLLSSYGITSTKKGRSLFSICPFHDVDGHSEKTPSLSIDPNKNLFHCFSCEAKGNVIQFVQEIDGIGFRDAVDKLLSLKPGNGGDHLKAKDVNQPKLKQQEPEQLKINTQERQKVLQQVISKSTENLRNSKVGRQYLEGRGIDPLKLFDHYDIGYFESKVYKDLAPTEKAKLQTIGLYNKNKALFEKCIIFPLKKQNTITTIYGRRIGSVSGHYLLPCSRSGLYLSKTGLNPKKPLILTESIIDSLSLFAAGIPNTLPLLGINGFLKDHLEYLNTTTFPKIYIALNGDTPGKRAASQLQQNLKGKGLQSDIIELPENQDINDMLKDLGENKLKEWFLKKINETENKTPSAWEDGDDIYVLVEDREYRIRGLTNFGMDRLKINIKAYKTNNEGTFYIDTLDLYQSRAREHFINHASKVLETENQLLSQDINDIITVLEDYRILRKNQNSPKKVELSEEEYNAALKYLQSPNLLERIYQDFVSCGMVGNKNQCLLAYLGSLSRLTDKPFGVLIVSRSGAGKSFLQEMVSSFVPAESLLRMTRLTGQSLFYQGKEGLKNKLLTIEEDEGMQEAMYSIRTLLSSQRLQLHGLKTDPKSGELTAMEKLVQGPASVMISTTELSRFDFESVNRFLVIFLDESTEQTYKILTHQQKMAGKDKIRNKLQKKKIEKLHQNIQRLLQPLTVVNSIGTGINYPPQILNTRREHNKASTLIETVALLHQYQRKIQESRFFGVTTKYIEVQQRDIDIALSLSKTALRQSLDELSPLGRQLLESINELVKEKHQQAAKDQPGVEYWQVTFTRKELRELSDWSIWHLRQHCKELVEAGYITPRLGRKGQQYSYSLVVDKIPQLPDLQFKK